MLTVSTSSFDSSFLPAVQNWQEKISAISWLTEFATFHPQLNTLDTSDNIRSTASRLANGPGFAQATLSERPVEAASGVNSMPCAEFDGDGTFNILEWAGDFATGDFTKVVIFQVPDLALGQMDLLSDNGDTEKHQLFITTGDQLRATVGDTNEARSTIPGTMSANTPYVAICGYTDATGALTLQLNGGTAVTDTVLASTFTGGNAFLGAANDSGDGPFNGYIGAVMIGNEDVFAVGNELDHAAILQYASEAWGVTLE